MGMNTCQQCGRDIGDSNPTLAYQGKTLCQGCYAGISARESGFVPTNYPGVTSGLAVTSFVLSLIGILVTPLLILGFIFGLIAMSKIKKSQGQLKGHGLAVAGVSISAVFFVIAVMIVTAIALPPIMRGRIDAAKWSEGKAMMGTISTALRMYRDEVGPDGRSPETLDELGFIQGDFDGVYFGDSDFAFMVSSMNPLTYEIVCISHEKPEAPLAPAKITLTQDGEWISE